MLKIEDQQAPNPDALDPQYVLTEAYGGFSVKLEYIDTRTNQLADDLSRNLLASFLSRPSEYLLLSLHHWQTSCLTPQLLARTVFA